LLTKPFVLPAGELHVNAATKDGSLHVAVCDEKGEPIKGFEASNAVRADKTAIPVHWPEKLERLHGQTVRLRFTLEKGKLYSFWVGAVRTPSSGVGFIPIGDVDDTITTAIVCDGCPACRVQFRDEGR